jgi:hypothetical protein
VEPDHDSLWSYQGIAQACKCRISKLLSLLRLALCCTVLLSRWCQVQPCLSQRRHVRLLILSSHTSGFTDIHPKYGCYYLNSALLFRALKESVFRVSQHSV